MSQKRRPFAVVTDSAADITPARAAALGVHVVPLAVIVDDETYDDGALSQRELFERITDSGDVVAGTSQPSPGTLARAYESALDEADEVLAIHISSRLSGTCDLARTVAQQFGGRVHVFDSRNLSWGIGWQVVAAATAAEEGLRVSQALPLITRARDETRIVVTLDSLDRLNRSGRIGSVAAYLGALLNVKVSVAVNPAGAFVPVRGSRSNSTALRSMLAWISAHLDGAEGGSFAVGHALAADRAEKLAAAIHERWRVDELVMYEAGSAISIHAGTIWGVAFRPSR